MVKQFCQRISIVTALVALVTACSNPGFQFGGGVDDSGFGGTGIVVYSVADEEGESGFGGTGIVGNISAFGSIWVNGLEIVYPDDVVIESNLGDSQPQLKLGQTVILETDLSPSTGQLPTTSRIRIHYQFAGPVQRLSKDAVVINDQQIIVTNETLMDEGLVLAEGGYLAVNAFSDDSGNWQASRLNLNPLKVDTIESLPDFAFSDRVTRVIVDRGLQHLREQWHIRDRVQHGMHKQPIMRDRWHSEQQRRQPMQQPMREMRELPMNPGAMRSQLHELHEIRQQVRQFPPPPPGDQQPPALPPN